MGRRNGTGAKQYSQIEASNRDFLENMYNLRGRGVGCQFEIFPGIKYKWLYGKSK